MDRRRRILQELDRLIAVQGALLFQNAQYDEEASTAFGIALLDFLRLYGVEVRAIVAGGRDTPLTGKYGDVLRPFLLAMEAELHANAGKGDRPGWLKMRPETALLEIYYHLGKLQRAVKDDNGPGIQEFAADVANMTMMLLDICGGLAHISPIAPIDFCVWRQQDEHSEAFSTSCRNEYFVIDAEPGLMRYCTFCGKPAEFQKADPESAQEHTCPHPGCTQTDGAPCAYPKCPQRSAQG